MSPQLPAVTVVVPVYRDLEVTRRCLESLATSALPATASVLVIDDHSPEPAVSAFCRELCTQRGFDLVVNDQNDGFVVTANRGISLAKDTDILLLNSDTIVTGDWLRRLQGHAYADEATATVTPFSNEGTICSYPVMLESNELPPGWTAGEVDRLFAQANNGLNHPIPTAVGFCMYIKRKVLDQIGLFDEQNFGQGYGEECDFSLRASAKNWQHVAAADVFVYHAGSVSFAEEAQARKRKADKTMLQMHPQYNQLVSGFLQNDPLYKYRQQVDELRLQERPEDSRLVLEEHARYSRSVLDRFEDYLQEKSQLEAEVEELETRLADCRDQFAITDAALTHADEVVARQQGELTNLDEYAKSLKQHIANLEQVIHTMEQSRSWRYTAWLRRNGEN